MGKNNILVEFGAQKMVHFGVGSKLGVDGFKDLELDRSELWLCTDWRTYSVSKGIVERYSIQLLLNLLFSVYSHDQNMSTISSAKSYFSFPIFYPFLLKKCTAMLITSPNTVIATTSLWPIYLTLIKTLWSLSVLLLFDIFNTVLKQMSFCTLKLFCIWIP